MPAAENLADKLKINVGGTDLTAQYAERISRLTVESSLRVPDMAVIYFEAITVDWLDSGPFQFGADLKISLSQEDSESTFGQVFDGQIVAVEPTYAENMISLTVRGYDKGHLLNRAAKTKAFNNVTDSDIATKVAQDAGLSPDVDSTTETFLY